MENLGSVVAETFPVVLTASLEVFIPTVTLKFALFTFQSTVTDF